MRYLGIDYGSKRIGLAISDDTETFAFPLSVLENRVDVIEEIGKICKEKEIGSIVLGESKNLDFQDNEIMKDIKVFMGELQNALQIPVYLHPEFLTSVEAERLQGKNDMLDASAAALILKSYLDTIRNHS